MPLFKKNFFSVIDGNFFILCAYIVGIYHYFYGQIFYSYA